MPYGVVAATAAAYDAHPTTSSRRRSKSSPTTRGLSHGSEATAPPPIPTDARTSTATPLSDRLSSSDVVASLSRAKLANRWVHAPFTASMAGATNSRAPSSSPKAARPTPAIAITRTSVIISGRTACCSPRHRPYCHTRFRSSRWPDAQPRVQARSTGGSNSRATSPPASWPTTSAMRNVEMVTSTRETWTATTKVTENAMLVRSTITIDQKRMTAISIRRTLSCTMNTKPARPNSATSRRPMKSLTHSAPAATTEIVVDTTSSQNCRPARTAGSLRSSTVSESPIEPLTSAVPSTITPNRTANSARPSLPSSCDTCMCNKKLPSA